MKVGDPLYRLVSNRILKAHLPYPRAPRAHPPGQPVRLTSPQQPDRVIEGSVEQVKPTVSETSRAIDVQVRLDNDGGLRCRRHRQWRHRHRPQARRGGGARAERALRPAGKVVVCGRRRQSLPAHRRARRQAGRRIEIVRAGPGEVVAEDGAGFSDGAAVTVKLP